MTTRHTESLADWFAPTARPGFRQYVDLARTATPLQGERKLYQPTRKVKHLPLQRHLQTLSACQSRLFLMNAKLYLNGFFNLAHIFLGKNARTVKKP